VIASEAPARDRLAEHGVRGVAEALGGEQEASKTRKIRSVRRRFGDEMPAW